ncbi:MAG: alpha/beta fold hydrolase [Steroidobacteraceae bacterium]
MPTVNTPGATIYYETAGDKSKPALLLLHSLGCALGMYDQQVAALQSDFFVIRPDVRGHGKSKVQDERESSIASLVADVIAVLDAEGIQKAHWAGVSLGGMLSMWAAAKNPERVLTATIANTGARSGNYEQWQGRIKGVMTEGMEVIAKMIGPRWFTERFLASGSPLIEQTMQQVRTCDPRGYATACSAIRDMDQSEQLKTIKLPCLVIGGKLDIATPPAMAQGIQASIPGAKYAELDAAHLSNVEAAADFNRALREHIAANS